MNRIRFIMVLSLSVCWFSFAFCQQHPREVAEQFFYRKLKGNGINTVFRFEPPVRQGDIWIFECKNPEGFVLVKEADCCRIAGYSIQNRLTRNNMIPGPAMTFIESLAQCSETDFNPAGLKSSYHPIGPMISSAWSQEGYFNYYCPEDPAGPDNHVYVGCTAVAMGQIIRYFGKFNDFQLAAISEDINYGTLQATIGNYDWNRMENRPVTLDTEVSQLLFGLGVLTRMGYGPTGSSTSNYNVYEGFKKLKYLSATRMVRGTTVNDTWIKNFYQNIADFQPVYLSGSGHAFICDGIDADGLFHFNLGWYGYGDGYYPLNLIFTINPSEAIFNLRPYSNNLPPANLTLDTVSGQKRLSWERHRLAASDPVLYRVYLNDTLYFDTSQTFLGTSGFPAGNHEIMVTAIYPQGESSWIGPIRLRIQGDPVNIPDMVLRSAIMEELVRENVTPVHNPPAINQLLKIQRLEIRQPLGSLAGLEYCRNIQILIIAPAEPTNIDLGPVSLLKRLKWLDIQNIQSPSLDLLAQNNRLVHLELTRCPAVNFNFLSGITGLISLQLHDIPVTDTQVFSSLQSLRKITLSACNLTQAGFIQAMPNLESIDLTKNQLQRFRLTDKLPGLHELNISQNQISDLYFLENIPNIRRLNLADNQIARFITGVNFKYIGELNLDRNFIDSLWIGFSMPNLRKFSIQGNKINNIRQLNEYMPGLTSLNLADNLIQDFWKGSLQALEYLDFSNNRLTLLNHLTTNPLLKHINLSNNQLSDIYPVFTHSNSVRVQYLDLTGNPLSAESKVDFAPFLTSVIDTFLIPDFPEEYSPGNPQPIRNKTTNGQTAVLSWLTGQLPADGFYEVYAGQSQEKLTLSGQVSTPGFPLDVSPGQRYYWRVRTVLRDTSFFSGLFNFNTYQPLSLPFKETFESYLPFSLFTEFSDFWIKSANGPTVITDGRIDPYRRSEGKQSLKLANASELTLPIGHLYQSTLYISMYLLIEDGCMASVRLTDINGADLGLYFKSNKRCDLVFNNQLLNEVPYTTSEWFPLQLNLYSKGNEIWIRIGDTDIPISWVFTGNTVHVGDIGLASAPGPNWPYDGQPLFRVDNMEIKASGSLLSESTRINQEIQVYPNPANEFIYIEIPNQALFPEIRVFDFSGRLITMDITEVCLGRWKISTMNLVPGIYIIMTTTTASSGVAKICISR